MEKSQHIKLANQLLNEFLVEYGTRFIELYKGLSIAKIRELNQKYKKLREKKEEYEWMYTREQARYSLNETIKELGLDDKVLEVWDKAIEDLESGGKFANRIEKKIEKQGIKSEGDIAKIDNICKEEIEHILRNYGTIYRGSVDKKTIIFDIIQLLYCDLERDTYYDYMGGHGMSTVEFYNSKKAIENPEKDVLYNIIAKALQPWGPHGRIWRKPQVNLFGREIDYNEAEPLVEKLMDAYADSKSLQDFLSKLDFIPEEAKSKLVIKNKIESFGDMVREYRALRDSLAK